MATNQPVVLAIQEDKRSSTKPTTIGLDTFSLLSLKRDPFLGKLTSKAKVSSSPRISPPNIIPKPKHTQAPKSPFPKVTYAGKIVNKQSDKAFFILLVDGSEHIVTVGSVVDSLIVKGQSSDSIFLEYKGARKGITK